MRRNAAAITVAVCLTVAVEMGVWLAARGALTGPSVAAMTVFAVGLWTLIAGAVFGASGRDWPGGVLRAGSVIDAGAVVLVVLAASDPAVGWLDAVKIYLVLAGVGMTVAGVARWGGSPRSRQVMGAVGVLAMVAICAGPLWTGGAIMAAGGDWPPRLAWTVVALNPVFAISGTVGEAGFTWQERPVMYEFGVLGRDVPMPSVSWHVTALNYAAAALAAWCVPVVIRRRRDRP